MKAKHLSGLAALLLTLTLPTLLSAENGAYSGAGGSFSAGSSVGTNITVSGTGIGSNATVSLTCPITSFGAGTYQWNWQCAGGTITIASTDNSIAMKGTFTSGKMTFSGSGGGRGGHVSYWYQFSGSFTSRVAVNGAGQGALGSVSFWVKTTSASGSGSVGGLSLGWSSEYNPLVVALGSSLVRADNLTGLYVSYPYGTWGNGTGQFENIAGLAHDASYRLYITDSSVNRLVRIDNLKGQNWTELGTQGSDTLQFSDPTGVAVDKAGKIWVVDTGNNRIVRMDDMTGTNWTTFGTAGSGANQFNAPMGIAFDAQGRIYVTDPGNARLVRFDDITGANWTTISTLNIGIYAYNFAAARGVAVLPSGKIVVSTYQYVYEMDDMTGANGKVGNWGGAIAGISADPSGAFYVAGAFTPGLAQAEDAIGTGYLSGALGQNSIQPTAVLAVAKTISPMAAPLLSRTSIAYGHQNMGEPTSMIHVALQNIGAEPMPITSVTAGPDFLVTNPCPATLGGGNSCTLAVQFQPTKTGPISSQMSIVTSSVHPQLNVALSGTGTQPIAALVPGTLTFNPQQTTTTSSAQTVVLTNTGSGPLTISNISASGDFGVTHNCPSVVAAGNGCTLQVTFTPTDVGTRTGTLSIADDNVPAGVTQTVGLTGTGSTAAPMLTLTPQSLYFPAEQVGATSAAQTLILTNVSATAASLSAPVIPSGFTGSTTCGASLAAGKTCKIQVSFAPSAAGAVNAAVSIPVTSQTPLTAGVAGTGVTSGQPMLVATPSPVSFGNYVAGDNPSMSMTVTNPKGYAAGFRSGVLTASPVFTETGSNCPSLLAAGASCTVTFMFQPAGIGTYSTNWTLTESSGAQTQVTVTGNGATDGGGGN